MKIVSFIGMGLIGGSIALALKQKYGEQIQIRAYDQSASQLQLALSLGVVDQGFSSVAEVVEKAEVIFICTPVQSLCSLLKEIMLHPRLTPGAIITDVGSTKEEVVRTAEQYQSLSKGVFIGGHPMAGSHKSGVEAATERLFENAYYVITPGAGVEPEVLSRLIELLSATRAKIIELEPAEHDQIVGAISHFPHLIASSLVEHVYQYQQENEWYLRLAAGGFRDITRIASSHPKMWSDITLSNRKYLLRQLRDWRRQMDALLEMVEQGDPEPIETFFRQAKQIRDGLPEKEHGAIPSFFDLYVDVPDHPGVIGQITTLLGEQKISITNISILETREDIMGALRLSFRNETDLNEAREVIRLAGYAVYRRE